jgi:hypothetical protein
MSTKCEACNTVVYRRRLKLEEPNKGKFLGFECGCLAADRIPRSTVNPFKIRFDHVANEFGGHLEVESIRQLSAAEKRLGFQSVVLNSDAQNFDDPPQQAPINVADIHNWKYSDRQRYARRFA